MKLHPIPAFSDNYIWVIAHGQRALVVDPGESAGVLAYLAEHQLTLEAILVTHHHADHVGGVQALSDLTGAQVWAPAKEWAGLPSGQVQRVSGDYQVSALGLNWQVMDVPGHTAGHVAYVCPAVPLLPLAHPVLFCGDTLFSGGCGRLFEGTPAQMLASLDALARLPDDTLVCCTHEYTLSNLRFACAVEPQNQELQAWQAVCQGLRERHQPTLPSTVGQERMINPFLRVRVPAVRHSALQHDPQAHDDVAVFAALREWKNHF
jgi:hydroxyacylglutathione hydrolase